ncbi:MAG: methionyl-tRNA formyltransferase [Pseudomonadota bacterium]
MPMRIIFMGTPEFSVPTLHASLDAGHQVAAVYTQPPRAAGRGQTERRSPVHEAAIAASLPVHTPLNFKAARDLDQFSSYQADVAVVIAYGLLLPHPVLAAPAHGCLNMHASRLPRWRGAAPIQRAIMAGDAGTAAMVMRMELGLDTGPVCISEDVEIGPDTTAGELHDTLKVAGACVMVSALAKLAAGELTFTPQPDEGVTYAKKIEKSEARICFDRPASDVHNHIRGLSPFPGAWFEVTVNNRHERIKVIRSKLLDGAPLADAPVPGTVVQSTPHLDIACQDGRSVRLVTVQRAGKRACGAEDMLRGCPIPVGTQLS